MLVQRHGREWRSANGNATIAISPFANSQDSRNSGVDIHDTDITLLEEIDLVPMQGFSRNTHIGVFGVYAFFPFFNQHMKIHRHQACKESPPLEQEA
ncbi:MAG: hypothetical protein QHI48_09885 [Bacteroidota bacterium]|nr:hypothetical protein [Bacteroidota bacterium]